MFESVELRVVDHVAILSLDRPNVLNAINNVMAREILAICEALAEDTEVRVLLLTGRGRGFCVGADLQADQGVPAIGDDFTNLYNPMITRILRLPIPVVTAVNGPAVGAGCSIALVGDIVLAARSAYFAQAFVNVGLVPDTGSTWLLPRLIGRCRASTMMMLGQRVSATQALEWGMIAQICDEDALQNEALSIANTLAQKSSNALRLIKRGLLEGLDAPLDQVLRMEGLHQVEALLDDDYREGVAAFREKRTASFGRRKCRTTPAGQGPENTQN